ncbi:MAG: TIGR03620 family F420-dependent LLM class oxidoreductase [Acidimicrobiales bacterium]
MVNEVMTLPRIGIWTAALDFVPTAEAQELAVELEQLGYGAIWLPEVAGREVFVHLGLLLSRTERLVGATGIANIWARDAVSMTAAAKSLTEAFPDRVVVGLGVSHRSLVEDLRGHSYETPLVAMRRYLEAMAKSPFTAHRPQGPARIVLAALGPKMIALATELTDGILTYFVPPEHTVEARQVMGDHGTLCVEQAVLLEEDPIRAREIGRAHTAIYIGLPNYQNNFRRMGFGDDDFRDGGSDRLIDTVVAWGDEEKVLARVRAHFDAGADHVCVQMLAEGRRDVPRAAWRDLAPGLMELAASKK